jgi:hypothetical protein
MINIICWLELLVVCGALLKARSCLFGLSFFIPSKKPIARWERDEKKDNPSAFRMASSGSKILSILSVGQFF